MRGKAFLDSNVLIYGAYGDDVKKEKTKAILIDQELEPVISIQVLKEFTNVCLHKKLPRSTNELISNIEQLQASIFIAEIGSQTIIEAIRLKESTGYSFYDSLIIATALEQDCQFLFSEDLHHGQTIKRRLKIINPFT